VADALRDPQSSSVRRQVQLALALIRKMTLEPDALQSDDYAALRAAGVHDDAIEDVIQVCAGFNIINRIADALEFAIPGEDAFEKAGPRNYQRAYALSK